MIFMGKLLSIWSDFLRGVTQVTLLLFNQIYNGLVNLRDFQKQPPPLESILCMILALWFSVVSLYKNWKDLYKYIPVLTKENTDFPFFSRHRKWFLYPFSRFDQLNKLKSFFFFFFRKKMDHVKDTPCQLNSISECDLFVIYISHMQIYLKCLMILLAENSRIEKNLKESKHSVLNKRRRIVTFRMISQILVKNTWLKCHMWHSISAWLASELIWPKTQRVFSRTFSRGTLIMYEINIL